jgi:hypothetical protein
MFVSCTTRGLRWHSLCECTTKSTFTTLHVTWSVGALSAGNVISEASSSNCNTYKCRLYNILCGVKFYVGEIIELNDEVIEAWNNTALHLWHNKEAFQRYINRVLVEWNTYVWEGTHCINFMAIYSIAECSETFGLEWRYITTANDLQKSSNMTGFINIIWRISKNVF